MALRQPGTALRPPTDQPWGMREMALRTVDGHRMMLASRLGEDGGNR